MQNLPYKMHRDRSERAKIPERKYLGLREEFLLHYRGGDRGQTRALLDGFCSERGTTIQIN